MQQRAGLLESAGVLPAAGKESSEVITGDIYVAEMHLKLLLLLLLLLQGLVFFTAAAAGICCSSQPLLQCLCY
jgi:hypothetical protein